MEVLGCKRSLIYALLILVAVTALLLLFPFVSSSGKLALIGISLVLAVNFAENLSMYLLLKRIRLKACLEETALGNWRVRLFFDGLKEKVSFREGILLLTAHGKSFFKTCASEFFEVRVFKEELAREKTTLVLREVAPPAGFFAGESSVALIHALEAKVGSNPFNRFYIALCYPCKAVRVRVGEELFEVEAEQVRARLLLCGGPQLSVLLKVYSLKECPSLALVLCRECAHKRRISSREVLLRATKPGVYSLNWKPTSLPLCKAFAVAPAGFTELLSKLRSISGGRVIGDFSVRKPSGDLLLSYSLKLVAELNGREEELVEVPLVIEAAC